MRSRACLALATCLLLAGCATTAAPPEERHPRDPWEPYNRNVFVFNSVVDRVLIRPLAEGYGKITPKPARQGIRNFFANIGAPVVIANLLLQGRPADAGTQFKRFFVNSTFGLAGLLDSASSVGLEAFDEDFGQTMAVWGWEDSRFIMLPLFGPSTVRDGLGRIPDGYADFVWRWTLEETTYALIGLNVIQMRHSILPLSDDIESAFDPYSYMRDGWLQQRRHAITNGEDSLPDYDTYLDEDWEE